MSFSLRTSSNERQRSGNDATRLPFQRAHCRVADEDETGNRRPLPFRSGTILRLNTDGNDTAMTILAPFRPRLFRLPISKVAADRVCATSRPPYATLQRLGRTAIGAAKGQAMQHKRIQIRTVSKPAVLWIPIRYSLSDVLADAHRGGVSPIAPQRPTYAASAAPSRLLAKRRKDSEQRCTMQYESSMLLFVLPSARRCPSHLQYHSREYDGIETALASGSCCSLCRSTPPPRLLRLPIRLSDSRIASVSVSTSYSLDLLDVAGQRKYAPVRASCMLIDAEGRAVSPCVDARPGECTVHIIMLAIPSHPHPLLHDASHPSLRVIAVRDRVLSTSCSGLAASRWRRGTSRASMLCRIVLARGPGQTCLYSTKNGLICCALVCNAASVFLSTASRSCM
ncbi:hypothetical protein C8R44DRAFT_895384 [Mycena epipterygia]|nr:hypothetical protein C8R44DRAFT_895384 [Mycena epipterygia]